MHGTETPSHWITRHAHLVKPHGTVLDLACGYGRHTRFFAARGCAVTALDRDADALATLASVGCETVLADIENAAWPLNVRVFDAVVVTNYLWRALLPQIVASVAPNGVLLYETFARGNEFVGKPSNPNFLLNAGELLQAAASQLRVLRYEDGFEALPTPRFMQRIAALRLDESSSAAVAARALLL